MRKLASLSLALALCVLVAPQFVAEDEQPWFDIHNCAICKNLSKEKGLMEHVQWEAHVIANGMLTVATVPPEYEEAFKRSHDGMLATVQKLQTGEPMHLCGFCMSYGKLAMAGARMEDIPTKAGHIGLVTSDDPDVVAMIHEHAERTIAEAATWEAQRKAGA